MSLKVITNDLIQELEPLRFSPPTHHVYNPLVYALPMYREYLERCGRGPKQAVLVGMNPGPWGMVQTGIPFGDVGFVRDWLGFDLPFDPPERQHPKRPILGLDCGRGEVSGQRVWGWARDRFGSSDAFFERFFVANYCPLAFMEEGGRNRTPDKLPAAEREPLLAACDRALRRTVEHLQPRFVVGIGAFAEEACRRSLDGLDCTIGRILHPSPASPAANRGWAEQAEAGLRNMGVVL